MRVCELECECKNESEYVSVRGSERLRGRERACERVRERECARGCV